MSGSGGPSLRIDWFDGTLVEESRQSATDFTDEEQAETPAPSQPQQFQKKPIGYKKLLDISMLKPPALTLEISHKNSFWYLMDSDLKGDFIVLIVKILANVYKSLEVGEKSMIVNILKSKFIKSNFLNTLKEYLSVLPAVRVVEKRMNSQFWDDAEAFYFNVLSICQGIYNFSNNNKEQLCEALSLLSELETSVIGVKEEHTERFRDELFYGIEDLKVKVNSFHGNSSTQAKTSNSSEKDPNHFKNLNIFPTKEDLLGKKLLKIQPNIINGAYPNVDHYLDVQFKLLREDCFGPLREGICKYMDNPNKRRHENIRVYPKVRIIRTYVSNNKVGHLVDIAWTERINQGLFDSRKYVYNKRLMFGSLLLFTSDNFETILCATVLDSGMGLLSDGYIAVSFHSPVSKKIFQEKFVMVESEVFFEPYHRVLKVMQESMDDLPMKKYIVDVQMATQPPAYLTPETIYTLPETKEDSYIPVLDPDQWPTPFEFDNSQMEAYKLALTREFAVIQGPPGTGKTFIGVKIASTLLKNLSLEGTPMLIICYTNHALDQFLEGILKITDNIVRLGSQSKNKALENYTLNSMRTKIKCRYSYLYSNKRKELEKIFDAMTEVQSEIEKCEKEIISYKSIKPYLKVSDELYELKSSNDDPVLKWLFNHLDGENDVVDEEVEDWEKIDDLEISTDKLDTCFSEQWALKDIDSMMNSIKYVKDVTQDEFEARKMVDKFEDKISKVKRRLSYFKHNMSAQNESKNDIKKCPDLYSLKPESRWTVYLNAVASIKSELMNKMNALLEQHTTVNEELEEVATLIDGEVMRTVRVVGVTTTTAARRHDLLKRLMSPIVIVEEAAEVLEAHIVASLTTRCQHLILIGDHKQLKPSAAHYRLAKDYNLEISLFERMIRNGVHSRTLTTQRRMRHNFVQLIVPAIYETLDSHPAVLKYGDVKGMRHSLWFYSHDVFEDSEGMEDSWSHKNTFEAKWCVSLADCLRRYYEAEEITILTTYTGQATLIKELSKNHPSLRDVKTTVVDNYQGEENRIVILSLVRSNRDNKIGFLAAENRICVALSRAKEGFYIFGNMKVLQAASSIWKAINAKLTEQNAIGDKITISCEKHKDNFTDICSIEEWNKYLPNTCQTICKRNDI